MGDESDESSISKKGLPGSGPSKERFLTTSQTLWNSRIVDAFLAAGGAAGSLAILQIIQDYLVMGIPIARGFLVGSAIKLFLNRNPPDLAAFWKSTVVSIVMGSSLHSYFWKNSVGDGEETTILSNDYNGYFMLFVFMMFWKLDAGTIWGAGKSLCAYIAFESGYWGKDAPTNGSFGELMGGFPLWFVLGPYLIGHMYLYICALWVAKIRQRARIFVLKHELGHDKGHTAIQNNRQELRDLFDRFDTNGDGRMDAMELKLALRASTGVDLPLKDCQYMIGSSDCDGDGTLDFNEFCESLGDMLIR